MTIAKWHVLKEQMDRIEKMLNQLVIASLSEDLSNPLDPARVRREDHELLYLERSLPADEFVLHQARLNAGRYAAMGYTAKSEEMIKRAETKARKIRLAQL